MNIHLVSFGQLDVEGERYDYDVVIDQGKVRKRGKKASKPYRNVYGHTPLSVEEEIPWHGDTLYIGTGFYGSLPVMNEVYRSAAEKGVELIVLPTNEVCALVRNRAPTDVNAVLHVTC